MFRLYLVWPLKMVWSNAWIYYYYYYDIILFGNEFHILGRTLKQDQTFFDTNPLFYRFDVGKSQSILLNIDESDFQFVKIWVKTIYYKVKCHYDIGTWKNLERVAGTKNIKNFQICKKRFTWSPVWDVVLSYLH